MMRYMEVYKIMSFLTFINIVLVSVELLVLTQRSWKVLCWGITCPQTSQTCCDRPKSKTRKFLRIPVLAKTSKSFSTLYWHQKYFFLQISVTKEPKSWSFETVFYFRRYLKASYLSFYRKLCRLKKLGFSYQ